MSPSRDRIEELLADKVLWGLDRPEQVELAQADDPFVEAEFEALELTGAAIAASLAQDDCDEALPAHVRARMEATGQAFLATVRAAGPETRITDLQQRTPLLAWSGWLTAAAALVIAALLWSDGRRSAEQVPVDRQLQRFVADQQDLVRMPWAVGPQGDIVWSPTAQRGFMVLRGLSPNDGSSFQYQLWIFDRRREGSPPVDGGVFDVRADERVIVPIDAKIMVHEAAGFAITTERPGGVVVSAQRDGQVVAATEM